MNAVWATFLRELRAYFFSPLAYVVLFFFLLVNGIVFGNLTAALSDPRAPAGPPMTYFFGSTALMLLILGVVLTMRLISEELRSGSIEVLMTAPITEGQVIAGKYLAALAFYAFLWLPTLLYAVILDHYSDVDWGPVAAGYLGILLVGALFLAIGVFASATTSSQLVAAMVTAALLFLLFLLGWFADIFASETAQAGLRLHETWARTSTSSRAASWTPGAWSSTCRPACSSCSSPAARWKTRSGDERRWRT